MAGEDEVSVGEGELDSFIQKINQWGMSLDSGEQALLGVLLGRAKGEESETEGFAISSFGDVAGEVLRPMVAGGGVLSAKPVTMDPLWVRS